MREKTVRDMVAHAIAVASGKHPVNLGETVKIQEAVTNSSDPRTIFLIVDDIRFLVTITKAEQQ